MALVHDMTEKTKEWRDQVHVTIYAEDHAEKLTCEKCGKIYISRGKHDPGICRDCEREQNAMCIGGEYDGEKAYN